MKKEIKISLKWLRNIYAWLLKPSVIAKVFLAFNNEVYHDFDSVDTRVSRLEVLKTITAVLSAVIGLGLMMFVGYILWGL